MSTKSALDIEGTDLPDEPRPKAILATVVTKTMPCDETPFWYEYRMASWAIQDTIKRVAGEEL